MFIYIWIAVFIVSLALLIKSSDLFVGAAEKIGLKAGLSPFITGVLIVGVGTSLPELGSAIAAAFGGATEIVIGNVLGSNITNIFLVLGIAAVIGKEFTLRHDLLKIDIPFLLATTLLIALMIMDGSFSRSEGIITLLAFVIYILFNLKDSVGKNPNNEKKQKPNLKEILFLFISPAGIFLGAKYSVDSVIALSSFFGIGTEVIALTAIALGTSLPEVLVTIAAARRGNPEMAVGNIIGSNIFNGLVVMGLPSLICNLEIPSGILSFSLPVAIASVLIYIFIVIDKKINRLEGSLLLIFYIYFLGKLFGVVV